LARVGDRAQRVGQPRVHHPMHGVRGPGTPEMDMAVDHSGHEPATSAIEYAGRLRGDRAYGRDASVGYAHAGVVDDSAVTDPDVDVGDTFDDAHDAPYKLMDRRKAVPATGTPSRTTRAILSAPTTAFRSSNGLVRPMTIRSATLPTVTLPSSFSRPATLAPLMVAASRQARAGRPASRRASSSSALAPNGVSGSAKLSEPMATVTPDRWASSTLACTEGSN